MCRWVAGSTVPITSDHLLVEDADTPADEIVYSLVASPGNGDLVVDGAGVTSFTQQLINDRRVMFAHRPGNLATHTQTHTHTLI